ncbi:biotin--[acetyl-CoA-carboxylase] ligase [Lacisediminihabitans profunda]|uniref:biotin--[biotin carboxyl-carrier protein] ligase n=1 Tax=Lacisediminihabitans profunda TaxID=2594790 RepID=A0A5C8ULV7_9MICO|nr:biotin--[acetyl-CoA-carboxylase] ligase [Lacisediminihabitans profunda]TXN28260.1 biotin--[acetyl-CoA-carboxylase] ligase [Lacisediminihabitans profunda]
MDFPRSRRLAARLEILDECGSTNTELVRRASTHGDEWPDLSALVTLNQTEGRGRLGRVWVAPPGRAIAISVLLRPRLPAGEPLGLENFGWLPLIAGVAMTRAVAALVPDHSVTLKWPNDVQVDGRKVSGLLAELLPSQDAVVIGAGLNLAFEEHELPTPTSTSLSLLGASAALPELADAALAGFLGELTPLYAEFLRLGADPGASGVAEAVGELCSTLGQQVKVQLPGGDVLVGTATEIDRTGRLVVTRSTDGRVVAVAAGDVTHLRYE